jgi:ATP-dependent exoDNAse (exonuclease V) beta subunit
MAVIQKKWLGWGRPILHSTIDFLLTKYRRQENWDLDNVLCVFPSSMAGRRLHELLAQTAQQQELVLRPPTIITSGELPEQFYQARFPFASDLEQTLCWTKVLRKMPEDFLKPLLIEVPSATQSAPWIELAGLLSNLHRELSSDLTLFGDVAKLMEGDPELQDEVERWKVLAKIQRAYLDELHKVERWDIQTARRYAIEKKEAATERDVIVIGAVDLNRAQRSFLEAVADKVTLLIGAPASWADGFDEYGTLRGSFWEDLPVELEPEQLITRATANEAADEVTRQLAYLGDDYSPQAITIGVPDTNLVPLIKERLDRIGLKGRYGAGISASQTPPVRLLRAVSTYLAESTFDALAALVRLPSVYDLLIRKENAPRNYLQVLDRYYQATLLQNLRLNEWPKLEGVEVLKAVFDATEEWLSGLRLPPVPLRDWAKPMLTVFSKAYENRVANLDTTEGSSLVDACATVGQAIAQLGDLPEPLGLDATLSDALAWVIRQIEKSTVPPIRDENAIEMIGWLDLSLDDAPVLLLTGVHDGTVPESVNGDAFLPNKIRSVLGLIDNTRRYARDHYSLHVLKQSREHFRIITNHHGVEGDPQTPSRLLLAMDPEMLAKRVMNLIKPPSVEHLPTVRGFVRPRPVQSNIPIPKPFDGANQLVEAMSASDFQSYIECPYRFYLRKIMRLTTIDDRSMELEANAFGNLLHDTLAKMMGARQALQTDVMELRKWLFEQLAAIAKERYGSSPAPVIMVQLEQARQRLAAFAKIQAARNAEGWVIHGTEVSIGKDKPCSLDIPGQPPMPLIGRIDRIDYHPQRKEYAIWDYKTGDTGDLPLKAHWAKHGWKQLQLPLYRHMAKSIGIDGSVSLGYILLPRAIDRVAFAMESFEKAGPPDAIAYAIEIVNDIRSGKLWPPEYKKIGKWDDFSAICQTNMARRWNETLEKQVVQRMHELIQDFSLEEVAAEAGLIPKETTDESSKTRPTSVRVRSRDLDQGPPLSISIPLESYVGKAPDDWFDLKMIEASAGTGKTYSLAMRMLRLLFAKQSPDGILATTFTRKAAGEILERVLGMLAGAIEDKSKLAELKESLKPLVINRQACLHHLASLCSNLHRLRVNTLDGFYSQLARSFALELQLPPGWKLADPFQEEGLREMAITRMFELGDRSQLRSLVSQLSRGEAKRSIRNEISSTVDNGYQLFRRIPAEAWSNLEVPSAPSEESISQSLALVERSNMNDKRFATSRDKLIQLLLMADWRGVLEHGLVKSYQNEQTYYKKPLPDEFLEGVKGLIRLALSHEFASLRGQTEAAYQLLLNYHSQLESIKRQQRLVTFSDISFRLSEWFKGAKNEKLPDSEGNSSGNHPFLPKAHYRMDSRIDHLLVDEFQDTSPTQWDILSPFAEAVVRSNEEDEASSFFCVGDVKQAIYGWRGGNSELFETVKTQLKGIQQSSLKDSYRSSTVIIDFVNRVFQNLLEHDKLGNGFDAAVLWVAKFIEHSTKKDLPGYIRIWNSDKGDGEQETNEEDGDGEGTESFTDSPLLDQCIQDVEKVYHTNPDASIGILVRTNRELGPIIHRLREKGIDASQEGGNPLDDSAAVELILSLIHLSDHPSDSIAHFHILNSPFQDFLHRNDGQEAKLSEADEVQKESTNQSKKVFPNKPKIDSIAAERLAVRVRQQLDESGYGKTIASLAHQLSPQCNERDQLRLDQLVQMAYTYDAIATLRNRDFVDYVRGNKVALSRPASVRVMTIHQSKGLEFDAVFLPGMSRQFMDRTPVFVTRQAEPNAPAKSIMRYVGKELQSFLSQEWQHAYQQYYTLAFSEAFSMFYVAITRARQAVYFYAKPSEKTRPTWDSLLHSILVDPTLRGAANQVVYEIGDPAWMSSKLASRVNATRLEAARPKSLAVRLEASESRRFIRQRESLKPSAAADSRMMAVKQLFEPSESVGAIVGTLVHRWFEEIIWLDDFQWDRKAMKELALRTLTPEQMPLIRIDDWLTVMEGYLKSQSVIDSISRSRYASWTSATKQPLTLEVTNERGLLKIVDQKLLRGTIDRLVLGLDRGKVVRAEILDYKTDSLNAKMTVEAWCRDRIEHHGPQLRLYRRVLCEQFGLEENQITLTLVLLSGDRLESIS